MKKHNQLLFFVLAFVIGLFGSVNPASAANCAPRDLFNSTTGQPCNNTNTIVGCLPGYLFSPVTGQLCDRSTFPPGCISNFGFSITTGQFCGVQNVISGEQVKCVFNGSNTNQSCSTYNYDGKYYTFNGGETAGGNVSGYRGETLTWKSSCGGYAYTTMDGQSEYANFYCSDNNFPSITVTSPNGGETLEIGKTYGITWSSSNVSTVMVDLVRSGYECHLTDGDVSNTGFLIFNLSNCVNGLSIPQASDYKIRVMYRSNASIVTQDESNNSFTVMSKNNI